MNPMTPTSRCSISRWFAGLLLAPLACAVTPSPAFALRAAGLEENGAREEVARELGVPEDATVRAQLLASSAISNSHVYATALGYGAQLLVNAHRARALVLPATTPPSMPPPTQPTGLEENSAEHARGLAWGAIWSWVTHELKSPPVISWINYEEKERNLPSPDEARDAMKAGGYQMEANYYGPGQAAWVKQTTGLEEGARLAAMLRVFETTPLSLGPVVSGSWVAGRAPSLFEHSVNPTPRPQPAVPIYRLWGFSYDRTTVQGRLLKVLQVGIDKGTWSQDPRDAHPRFASQEFTASEQLVLPGAQVAVTDASGKPLMDSPWEDLEPSSSSPSGDWQTAIPLPNDFSLAEAFLSVRLPLATTSAKIYFTTTAAGRRLAEFVALAESGGDPAVSMAPDTIALQQISETQFFLPAGSLVVTKDQAEAEAMTREAQLSGRPITAVPLAEATSLAALLQRLSGNIPLELPAGAKLFVEHRGDALRIYL